MKNERRTPFQKKCFHRRFQLLYWSDYTWIGFCPDCQMLVKIDACELEEDLLNDRFQV